MCSCSMNLNSFTWSTSYLLQLKLFSLYPINYKVNNKKTHPSSTLNFHILKLGRSLILKIESIIKKLHLTDQNFLKPYKRKCKTTQIYIYICALKIDPTMKSQNATNILFERTKTNLGKSGFFFFFLGKNDKGQTA